MTSAADLPQAVAPGPSARATPHDAVLDLFGARWRLDVTGLEDPLASRILELWARATDPAGAAAGEDLPEFVLGRDGTAWLVDGNGHISLEEALPYTVSRALTLASITRRTGECLLLHAAGVAGPDGRTLALVAASGTGKTTAARVLGRDLGYVTDETVAVEDDLTVRAYPKPLSLVTDPDAPHDKAESSPDELGLLRAPTELHLGGIVVLDRQPDAGEPTLERIGLAEAAVDVIPQTSALLSHPDPVALLCRALAAGGGPWRLTYAEVEECSALLQDLVQSLDHPDPAPPWESETGTGGEEPPVGDPGSEDTVLGPDTVVTRREFRYALHTPEATLVLIGQVPMHLPGMATTLWRAAEAPASIADLVAAAVEVHGPHPQAEDVVVETVRELLRTGLVGVG